MIVEVSGLTKRFSDVRAVSNVSFKIKKGEIVGFVGANGAGKTTTISLMLGFLRPTDGYVRLFGDLVMTQTAHQTHQRIGYAAGDTALPRGMTGRQYFRLVQSQYGGDFSKRLRNLSEIFHPELDKKIGTLSRGNYQKVALIAAFLSSPDIVILDEPTSGLDPIMQEAFLQLVRDEQARGTTVFMSSHYLAEVADVCTRVILMRRGEIITDMPADELLRRSGKQIRVVSGYTRTVAPSGAEDSIKTTDSAGNTVVTFSWNREPAGLQQWIAGVKQLKDIEVTEFDLEKAFKGMYDNEETA